MFTNISLEDQSQAPKQPCSREDLIGDDGREKCVCCIMSLARSSAFGISREGLTIMMSAIPAPICVSRNLNHDMHQ